MSMRFIEIEALFNGSNSSFEINSASEENEFFDSKNCDTHTISNLGELLLSFCEKWINTHLGIKMKSMQYLSRIDTLLS